MNAPAADLDLTAAIAAAAHAVHVAIAHDGTTPPYCGGPNDPQRDDAERAVAAAAPLIAAQVAEQIARALPFADDEWREYQAIPDQGYSHRAWLDARAARIAREAVR